MQQVLIFEKIQEQSAHIGFSEIEYLWNRN